MKNKYVTPLYMEKILLTSETYLSLDEINGSTDLNFGGIRDED